MNTSIEEIAMKVATLSLAVGIAVGAVVVPSFATVDPAFSIRVVDSTESTVLGLPAMLVLEVKNISMADQILPRYSARLRVDVTLAPEEAWAWLKEDEHVGRESFLRFHKEKLVVPPGWVMTTRRGFRPPVAGEYKIRIALHFRDTSRKESLLGEVAEHWVGEVRTNTVTVKVREPEGLDAEAYRAILALGTTNARESEPARFWRALAFEPGAGKLLMTRYVESIYAASVIHRKYAGGWLRAGPERVFSVFDRGFESQKGRLRCRKDASADTLTFEERYFVGPEYVMCRDSWLEIALENHPEAWFADEIRWKLALDRYLLGDPAACEGGLEELAEQARRPDVRARARDLLSAMRAKGMLPEEGTE